MSPVVLTFSPSAFRKLRLRTGMTLTEFGAAVGVSQATVWTWEAGRFTPKSSNLGRIANLCGCSLEDLFAPVTDDTPGGRAVPGVSKTSMQATHDAA